VFTERSEGKAAAINIAGSLRMQSWLIASTVANNRLPPEERSVELARNITGFENRLESPLLIAGLSENGSSAMKQAYDDIAVHWRTTFKPGAASTPGSAATVGAFIAEVPAFVARIDRLVSLIEEDLEDRIRTLRFLQGVALFLIVFVIFVAMYLMRTQVLVPLVDLLACSRAVRDGDFSVRAANTGVDELGQLGEAFNFMVEDLSRMYDGLETRVSEKTEELARTNRSLELLYNTTRALSEGPVNDATLTQILRDVERVIGVPAGVICAHEAGQAHGFPLASTAWSGAGKPHLCEGINCGKCFAEATGSATDGLNTDGRITIPLVDAGHTYGLMPLAIAAGHQLAPWQLKLTQTVGHHIGAALATARRAEERHRIALLEERTVIARELHDSLAQSLSYLKIQVTRLQALIDLNAPRTEVEGIIDELRSGLSNAYRQLRELLTTFRLRIEGRGLTTALRDSVDDFATRTGVEVRLDNRLSGVELASNEEIHVLQVVREALSNVEHHAHARKAEVTLHLEHGNRLRVRIDDDGRGLTDARAPAHHYGMAIMRDRASSLHGTLRVAPREGGGTRVELEFTPATPFPRAEAALA